MFLFADWQQDASNQIGVGKCRMSNSERPSASIAESIVIERSVEDVFAYYRDFRNLPAFLGDVMRVEVTGERTSRWTIRSPWGVDLQWTVVITEIRPNAFIAYQTESAASPARNARCEMITARPPGRRWLSRPARIRRKTRSPRGPPELEWPPAAHAGPRILPQASPRPSASALGTPAPAGSNARGCDRGHAWHLGPPRGSPGEGPTGLCPASRGDLRRGRPHAGRATSDRGWLRGPAPSC